MKIFLMCLTVFLASPAVWAQTQGDADKAVSVQEPAPPWPPLPDERNLIAFRVGSQPVDRFLIDTKSLALGEGGVIHYVLVMRGSGGARSTSFESIRCGTGEYRLHGSVGQDGDWRPLGNGAWKILDSVRLAAVFDYHGNDPRSTLASDYFCANLAPLRSPEEIIARLRGRHIDYLNPVHGVR